jgi:hypothetical protein
MAKTGERYTSARRQVLAKALIEPVSEPPAAMPGPQPPATPTAETAAYSTSDEAMRKATGRGHEEWFALLDAWGATDHSHTEIAEWLSSAHGAPSWWRQSITVDYERARGMRKAHEMRDGFSVSVTRTIPLSAEAALATFADPTILRTWLPDAALQPRPTRARLTARFDWAEPASRVVVTTTPKGVSKAVIAVVHERLPDAAAAARLKTYWRARLKDLPIAG